MATLYPNIRPGMTIRVYQRITDVTSKGEEKERSQMFEGIVLARRGSEPQTTITVRKISEGVGVEKILPLAMPSIEKIEVVKQAKVHRAKLYFLRKFKKTLKETAIKKA